MLKKKETALARVKRYVNDTNSLLAKNRLKVTGKYWTVDGVRCVNVVLEGNYIYPRRISLLCEHTDTILHCLTMSKGNVCILLADKKKRK